MEWLLSILYGLVSGLGEFFPISAEAHQMMVLRILGRDHISALLRIAARAGCFAGLLLCCRRELSQLLRARKTGRSRRKSNGELQGMLTWKLLKTAAVPMLLCCLLYPRIQAQWSGLNRIALLLIFNGCLLFAPRLFRSGNKDARSVSPLDGVLLGAGAGASVLPGISRVGSVVSLASLRGAGSRFSLNFALLLSVPALALVLLLDGAAVVAGGIHMVSAVRMLQGVLCGGMACLGSCCAIMTMRFLSVKAGFSGFAYYCWGAALFAFILFMTI